MSECKCPMCVSADEKRRGREWREARDAVVEAALALEASPDPRTRGDVALRDAVRRLREVRDAG